MNNRVSEVTMNSPPISRFHFSFIFGFANLRIYFVKIPWMPFLFRESTINFIFFPRIHYELTIFFANSPRIHYLFREFSIYFANILWFHYFFRINYELTIFFANSLWIRSLLHESVFREVKMNPLSFSRSRYLFAKLPWMNCLFIREYTWFHY